MSWSVMDKFLLGSRSISVIAKFWLCINCEMEETNLWILSTHIKTLKKKKTQSTNKQTNNQTNKHEQMWTNVNKHEQELTNMFFKKDTKIHQVNTNHLESLSSHTTATLKSVLGLRLQGFSVRCKTFLDTEKPMEGGFKPVCWLEGRLFFV